MCLECEYGCGKVIVVDFGCYFGCFVMCIEGVDVYVDVFVVWCVDGLGVGFEVYVFDFYLCFLG